MLQKNLSVEFLKLRRSTIFWFLPLAFSLGPVIGAVFMVIVSHPELGQRLGLLGAKAQLMAMHADWASYVTVISQMVGIGGMIVIGVMASFLFGREYAEGTAKNILALPVSRAGVVTAKLIVGAVWYAAVIVWVYILAISLGALLSMPGYTGELLRSAVARGARLAVETIMLISIPAWIGVASKGYFGPLGFTMFSLIMGNVFGVTGWGPWFPWAIVPLDSGMAGPGVALPGWGARIVLLATFCVGWFLTWRTFETADNLQ